MTCRELDRRDKPLSAAVGRQAKPTRRKPSTGPALRQRSSAWSSGSPQSIRSKRSAIINGVVAGRGDGPNSLLYTEAVGGRCNFSGFQMIVAFGLTDDVPCFLQRQLGAVLAFRTT
jgi:hypothetical protein